MRHFWRGQLIRLVDPRDAEQCLASYNVRSDPRLLDAGEVVAKMAKMATMADGWEALEQDWFRLLILSMGWGVRQLCIILHHASCSLGGDNEQVTPKARRKTIHLAISPSRRPGTVPTYRTLTGRSERGEIPITMPHSVYDGDSPSTTANGDTSLTRSYGLLLVKVRVWVNSSDTQHEMFPARDLASAFNHKMKDGGPRIKNPRMASL